MVLLFGRIAAVQPAGLVMSWPRPAGQVALVPGPDRLLTVRTTATAQRAGLEDIYTQANDAGVPDGAGSYLTGDGGVVLLSASITYQVADAAAYLLAQSHVDPALIRMFAAAAVRVTAGRTLDDVLVARPDALSMHTLGTDAVRVAGTEARRQAMRGDLVAEMNRRLAALDASGASLGVVVSRVDLDAALPPAAKIAFDGVLVAVQLAEQGIAAARTEAARLLQAADHERDRLLSAATAAAAERVGSAQAATATIMALEAAVPPASRPAMLDQLYRDGLASVLRKVGRVTAVDAAGGGRIVLPAALSPGSAP